MKSLLYYFNKRLKETFEVPLHLKHSPQKRQLPSISVDMVSSDIKRELTGRLWLEIGISANYLFEDGVNEYDIEDIKIKMTYALERLPTEGGRFFSAMTSTTKVNDGAVVGMAVYRIYMKEPKEADIYMRTLEQEFVTTDEAFELLKEERANKEPITDSEGDIGYGTRK